MHYGTVGARVSMKLAVLGYCKGANSIKRIQHFSSFRDPFWTWRDHSIVVK